MNLKQHIRAIPNFPKQGILFRDVTPLLQAPEAFEYVCHALESLLREARISKLVAIESRGFIFGAPVARALHLPLVLVRKPGKLPHHTVRTDYTLEYGSGALEMHADSLTSGDRVAIIDDLLATGGTARAAVSLARQCGAEVPLCAFVIELRDLKGREYIAAGDRGTCDRSKMQVKALVEY